MREIRAAREGGFTLIEIVIAVAIVATTVAAGFGVSLASRSLAVSTAAGEFDHFLDSARTMARELDGATLAFTSDAYGDGTEVRVFAGGPNGAPSPTTLPPLHARAVIEETEALGKVPFAFIVHANGALSGRPGYRAGDTTANDVDCPASGAFHFVIHAAGGSADRFVPCRVRLAANGPVTLTTWPTAAPAPSPTPCTRGPGCAATA
nr:type II secretion system GspH family protein [Candidatus Eremiobacteraeota bacterium]